MLSVPTEPVAVELPQDFTEFLERSGLPVPPLPLSVFNAVNEIAPDYFAADAREVPARLSVLADFERFLDDLPLKSEKDAENHPGLRYAGFGLSGYGMQSREVQLILDFGGLRFAAALPWDNAYNAMQAESAALQAAFEILQAVLVRIPEKGLLTVMALDEGLTWNFRSDDLSLDGDELTALLDFLNAAADGESADTDSSLYGFPPQNGWLSV